MTGRICGTGSYVPARIVENDELANLVDTNDAWIRERTGIARRHLAENETTSYMAAEAAKRALAQTDLPSIREAPQLRPRPRTKCRYFCHSSPPYVTYCPHRSPALSCKFLPECTPVQSEAQTKIHCTPHSDQIPPHALHESLFVPHMPCMEKRSRMWI